MHRTPDTAGSSSIFDPDCQHIFSTELDLFGGIHRKVFVMTGNADIVAAQIDAVEPNPCTFVHAGKLDLHGVVQSTLVDISPEMK